MEWSVFLILAAVCLIGSVVLAGIRAKWKHKSGRLPDPLKILFGGAVLSAILLYIPIYRHAFGVDGGMVETLLHAIYHTIGLFVVNGNFEFVVEHLAGLPVWIVRGYTVLLSVLLVWAPVLTFGFVLSFFQNLSAYLRYLLHFRTNTYIFSELNEKSLTLAQSLYENHPKNRFFVFTNVAARGGEQSGELAETAKRLGAVCFKKDIVSVNFAFHSQKSTLHFLTIGEDPSENVRYALKLMGKFLYREHTDLYVFSTGVESELLIGNAFRSVETKTARPPKMKVRRIHEVRSLIARTLYDNGFENLFESAYDDGTGIKKIHAVIVGMGQYGREMTRALSWFCQMNGYLARIDAFDSDPLAEQKFASSCPELMQFSGRTDVDGEAKYTIAIHAGVDVDTADFDRFVFSLPRTTYVLVALGNDQKNIATAVKLRGLFERMHYPAKIQAVVYDSHQKEALAQVTNFRGQRYAIDFIGDRRSFYSETVILGSDVEKAALQRHLKWGSEESFWQYDYYYQSSVASAIHHKLKIQCGIPGAEKNPEDRTPQERWQLRILEHCRWSAYMRSQGYVYSGSTDKESRNDLAKTSHCLVPFGDLPLYEQEKDDD